MVQPGFSDNVVIKAERLLERQQGEEGPITPDSEFPGVWWVSPSSGLSAKYRVSSDYDPERRVLTYVTCTCPHGANTGGGTSRCYHVAAVLMTLRDEKLAAEHQFIVGHDRLCTCGWPTEEDFAQHSPKWLPEFSEHLLDERRKLT